MKGWLEKSSAGKKELSLGQVLSKWDKRYLAIDGAILGWHKTEAEAGAVPQGFVEVAECTVTRDTTRVRRARVGPDARSARRRKMRCTGGSSRSPARAARWALRSPPLPAEAAVCTALAAQLTMPLAWAAHEGTLRQLWDALRLGHAVADEETAAVRLPTAAEELRLEHKHKRAARRRRRKRPPPPPFGSRQRLASAAVGAAGDDDDDDDDEGKYSVGSARLDGRDDAVLARVGAIAEGEELPPVPSRSEQEETHDLTFVVPPGIRSASS